MARGDPKPFRCKTAVIGGVPPGDLTLSAQIFLCKPLSNEGEGRFNAVRFSIGAGCSGGGGGWIFFARSIEHSFFESVA